MTAAEAREYADKHQFNKELMWEIEESIGEITDMKLEYLEQTERLSPKIKLSYKQNGEEKAAWFSSESAILQMLFYVFDYWSALPSKYPHSIRFPITIDA